MSWRPLAPVENLKARAEIIHQIRGFFRDREVVEIQTPVLASTTVTDSNIHSIRVPGHGYLQTSPEFHMKRLLAAGMPSCYQICPAFRADEQGVWHNPEFTMLEWYRLEFSMADLIREVKALLDLVLGSSSYLNMTVSELLKDTYHADVFALSKLDCLQKAKEAGLHDCDDYEDSIDFLIAHAIAQMKATRLVLTEYPEHGSALAKVQEREDGRFAQRFEFIIDGVEIANGYDELQDAGELRRRMMMDNKRRKRKGLRQVQEDERLLAAMAKGLPNCTGVAVGLDRLIALSLKAHTIIEAMSFR